MSTTVQASDILPQVNGLECSENAIRTFEVCNAEFHPQHLSLVSQTMKDLSIAEDARSSKPSEDVSGTGWERLSLWWSKWCTVKSSC